MQQYLADTDDGPFWSLACAVGSILDQGAYGGPQMDVSLSLPFSKINKHTLSPLVRTKIITIINRVDVDLLQNRGVSQLHLSDGKQDILLFLL